MKPTRLIIFLVLFVCSSLILPIHASAQSSNVVEQVFSFDTHGKNEAFIAALKPALDHMKTVDPRSIARVYVALFSGQGAGQVILVVRHPDMATIEQNRLKIEKDQTLPKLMAEIEKVGATLTSRSLLRDVTP